MSLGGKVKSGAALLESSLEETQPTSSINTTPLVDVMLVMLIIFLITVPVVVGTVEVELPVERNVVTVTKPENVNIAVDANGNVYWNQALVTKEDLQTRLNQAAFIQPQPEVHIRGDQETEYQNVGFVVEAAQRAGIARVGFITDKPSSGY
ncbi:biopolymer transporter ExbD [bacterium]|nr:biopolymer transporter ExbD [bacterium]